MRPPGEIDVDTEIAFGYVFIDGSSVTLSLSAPPGMYAILLWLWNDGLYNDYAISSINLVAGTNTIPFSAFTVLPPGGSGGRPPMVPPPPITIIVTEIPDRYIGNDSWEMYLASPGITGTYFGWSGLEKIEGTSAAFAVFDLNPGTYDVILWIDFYDAGWTSVRYLAASRIITDDGTNTIPFSAFTIAPPGLSEPLEHSERALPDRSHTRARSLRAAS